ncbi:sugar ABC transporter ATP-binding protein [Sphingomonas sp. NFR15]|uniref:sugar ABC transporter ATP-binding protein n=1 Tax=Sphingomonas sp. NFR15 TaxID=1566282 RepID=UPI0008921001|nr:sugar ABC transporter ATP-binding protein [Sphingomonas sp. NFR15]SDA10700.1 monosaccharide ABC transporter ATP-binding protein, CUT2 family (TC 3.A.1.2.-) [Sphingomonas sp. NFR15]
MVTPLLTLAGVTKTWPNGTVALRGVDLTVVPGRVHGLLGANGAGKSTLIKILSGAIPATGGDIIWRGQSARWTSPRSARAAGVATLYQHIPLVPTLSAADNILLEQRGWLRHAAAARARAVAVTAMLGDPFALDAIVGDLPIGARQMVAIAQALVGDPALVIMDEPTAALAGHERETVYRTIRQLADAGRAVLFVSHFLDEILALTDAVTVLRDGRAVLHAETATLDEATIAAAIAGRSVAALTRTPRLSPPGDVLLDVRGLRAPGRLAPTSLSVRAGEIVGIAGVLGSGRSELLHAIFGADPTARGEVWVNGRRIGLFADESVAAGIALVPEDRARQGFVPQMTIAENIALPQRHRLLDRATEAAAARDAIARLAIKADGPDALVSELSGGNAQKVVLAKWLTPDTRVLLLDEPTAGIDIGARIDILRAVRALADDGLAVMLVSSEFEELLAIADRILVLRDGAVVREITDPGALNEAALIRMTGGAQAEMGVAA